MTVAGGFQRKGYREEVEGMVVVVEVKTKKVEGEQLVQALCLVLMVVV